MHPIINIATKAARKAGDILLQSMERLDTINPSSKGLNDFVTDIDKRSESAILNIIKKAYPHHGIIAEESGSYKEDKNFVWIIDPLDGTHNYMRGFPHFSISIGFKQNGALEHGLVYDPVRQEMFVGSRGQGARVNDRRIRVSTSQRLENAMVGTGFPVRHANELPDYLSGFKQLMPAVSDIRCSGSAALDFCYVAAGRLDAFVEKKLHRWDMAAGVVIVREAGGLVADWQGGETFFETGSVIAATPRIFNPLMEQLKNV